MKLSDAERQMATKDAEIRSLRAGVSCSEKCDWLAQKFFENQRVAMQRLELTKTTELGELRQTHKLEQSAALENSLAREESLRVELHASRSNVDWNIRVVIRLL